METKKKLDCLVQHFGTQNRCAKKIGLSPSMVSSLLNGREAKPRRRNHIDLAYNYYCKESWTCEECGRDNRCSHFVEVGIEFSDGDRIEERYCESCFTEKYNE